MVKRFRCAFCGAELENFQAQCPHCGEYDVGWLDSVNGWHSGGTGTMPDGTECGECCKEDCADCSVWKERQTQRARYGTWECKECSNVLEIWLDEIEEEHPATDNGFKYERHHLMWHCTECGCDYENYWETQWGDTAISPLQQKLWG